MNLFISLFIILISSYGVLSAWVQKVRIYEGGEESKTAYYKPPLTFPISIAEIRSTNRDVVKYDLTGPGVTTEDYLNTKNGNWVPKFKIEADGQVYQLANVNREKYELYLLGMSGLDKDGNVIEPDGELEIRIMDMEDNIPELVESSLNGKVKEADDGKSPFMKVEATDADTDLHNKIIHFFIQPGSDIPKLEEGEGQRFTIDPKTGEVSVSGKLDYEKDQTVQFNVIVSNEDDGGDEDSQKVGTVTVKVEDSNDHAPEMTIDSVKSISELSKVDTRLYKITASDADEGINQKVYFEIVGGNAGGVFAMECEPSDDPAVKSVGYLKLVKELDYENRPSYDLSIKAYNKEAGNEVDADYATVRQLNIKVIDENEAPVFQNTPYVIHLTETYGEKTTNLVEPKPTTVTLEAEDKDFKSNQTITFKVNDPESWFTVNDENRIIQIATVDRERPVVKNGIYELSVIATDNYDHGSPASRNGVVNVYIADINDNAPRTKLAEDDLRAVVCEKPTNKTVIRIEATDSDSPENGAPFKFRLDNEVDSNNWGLQFESETTSEVVALFSDYNMNSNMEVVEIPFTISDNGSPSQTGSATLTATICACDDEGKPTCSSTLGGAGLAIPVIIAIIAVLLLVIILVLAVVAYRRRQAALVLKEPFFDDEDDVRENVQVYQEEGGEEDQEAYDLSALRAPLLEDPSQPVRKEVPLQQAPREPRGVPDDIGDYIGDAKDQADADPSAPPFDSLLVFDYEGAGSDAGSLSSINTATTDGSMDYDYLNSWGPRFKKLADMYNDGSDSD